MSKHTLILHARLLAIAISVVSMSFAAATALAQNSASGSERGETENSRADSSAAPTNARDGADADAVESEPGAGGSNDMQRLRLTLQDVVEDRLAHAPQLAFFVLGVGLVALGYGWRVYRVLVVVMGFLVGALSGALIAYYTRGVVASETANYGLIMALVGGTVAAFLAIPYIRFALFMLAGLAGGYVCLIAGQSLAPEQNQYTIYFGIAGFLVCGLVSLAFFELVVVIGTSALGACCIVTSALTMLFLWQPSVYNLALHEQPWSLPTSAIALSIVGVLMQMQLMPKGHLKNEKEKFAAKADAKARDRREPDPETRKADRGRDGSERA